MVAVSYLSGRLAQGGTLAPVDMLGFVGAVNQVVKEGMELYSTGEALVALEDDRFEFGFTVMEMLEKAPKIGLDGGWVPPPASLPPSEGEGGGGKKATACGTDGDAGANSSTGCADADAAGAGAGAGTGAMATLLDASASSVPDPAVQIGGDIEFADVTFRYQGTRKKILRGMSFKVPAGSFVGICGEFGAGKTTMFKLMLRLYDPLSGEIKIGGRNIKEYNPVWLRSQIGLSKQEAAIFTDYGDLSTLRANFTYGSETALERLGSSRKINDHLLAVLDKLQVKEHFTSSKFPQGLDTRLQRNRQVPPST
jgi:ABC-type multidrug transport system fused ATPase/permease subunit